MMVLKRWIMLLYLWLPVVCYAQQQGLERANDFIYTQANGTEENLYSLESEIVLLYFYDPTCEDCHELMEQLNASETVNKLLAGKRLQILAVYPEEDMDIWMPYTQHVPATWINGYDKGATINIEGLFLLTSLPTLYLLDEEKNIILQTTTFHDIEQELGKKIN